MHILVTNDDGPPSNQSSPYIHSLIKTLQEVGHAVSVILPHVQRSWIGKAHFVGQVTKPTYFRPGTLHEDDGTTHSTPLPIEAEGEEWVLVDGTPATCAQLGIYHFFQDRGPVDLVISGPNYGRNSTALFSLSSGTIGGAMEAATNRKKAIALSYAFYSRDHDPTIIAGASRLSVKLIEHLYNNWGEDVDLYTINMPLVEGVEHNKIMYTNTLQNYWSSGSSFQEIEPTEDEVGSNQRESEIRKKEENSSTSSAPNVSSRHTHKHFRWAPKFADIAKSIDESPPGNDGWAISKGYTSVTPLKVNFMHALPGLQGELKLDSMMVLSAIDGAAGQNSTKIYAVVNYEDEYVQPLILKALQSQLPPSSYSLISSIASLPHPSSPVLQITSYESLDFDHLLAHPTTSIANAYIIRKALIRKHFLAHTVSSWLTKYPDSILKDHVKPAVDFELDYAEFLDEALLEAYELHESFARNEDKTPEEREWWILKPSMSDRGQGIRLFSTEAELRAIFEEWEAEESNSETDSTYDHDASPATSDTPPLDSTAAIPSNHIDSPPTTTTTTTTTNIITSQLRHFIAQPYIHPPLLLPSHGNRKFHIRSYVLAVGALRVYVYKEMLALFAPIPYSPPGCSSTTTSSSSSAASSSNAAPGIDLRAHLTNTCLQDSSSSSSSSNPNHNNPESESESSSDPRDRSVFHFDSLPHFLPSLPPSISCTWHQHTAHLIQSTTAHLFLAAAKSQTIYFQTLPNAFEVFGLDWLVDAQGGVWLLEVNAFPDYAQTGGRLKGVVEGLWEGVVGVVLLGRGGGFGGGKGGKDRGEEDKGEEDKGRELEEQEEERRWGMKRVLDLDLGRR